VAAALIISHNLIMMDIIHQNCTSSGQGIPGPTPGARPGGGAIRASGGRLLPPRGTTGLSPKKPRGSNDGPANCLVGDEEAQGQHGTEKDQKKLDHGMAHWILASGISDHCVAKNLNLWKRFLSII
jgi:hypothetical protein